MDQPSDHQDVIQQPPSPVEVRDPVVRDALKQATIWLGLASAIYLAWQLSPAILLIVGGLVFAAMLDGGVRLIGRFWNGPRGVRLGIVAVLFVVVVVGFLAWSGIELAAQAGLLRETLDAQLARLSQLLRSAGIGGTGGRDIIGSIANEVAGTLGKLTQAVTTAAGVVGSLLLIMVLGLFIAAEPRLYERGIGWLTPMHRRERMAKLMDALADTLRRWVAGRLFAMTADGILTTIGLLLAGVPLAGLLGLISGLLAFIPNIGSLIAGTLIVLVGFSVGTQEGLLALAVYVVVQFVESNILTPLVERRVVDLAPAVVLSAQLLFGALFGILGVALADPIVAMLKVTLEHRRHPREGQTKASRPLRERGLG